jgi:molecular chaperone GrpE (heat shock protein)
LTKGTIIEVMKKGYLLNGQVLRISKVKISNTKNEKNASN